MKKTLSWILALVSLLGVLTACGKVPALVGDPLEFVADYVESSVRYASVYCSYPGNSRKKIDVSVRMELLSAPGFGKNVADSIDAVKAAMSASGKKLGTLHVWGDYSTEEGRISWKTSNYRTGTLEHTMGG